TSPSLTPALSVTSRPASCSRSVGAFFAADSVGAGLAFALALALAAVLVGGAGAQASSDRAAATRAKGTSVFFMRSSFRKSESLWSESRAEDKSTLLPD